MSNTTHSKVPTYLLGATVALSFATTIVGILTVSASYKAVVKAIKANNQLGYYTAQLMQPVTIAILTIGGIGLFVSLSALFLSLHRHKISGAAEPRVATEAPAPVAAPATTPIVEQPAVSEPVPAPVAAAAAAPTASDDAKTSTVASDEETTEDTGNDVESKEDNK